MTFSNRMASLVLEVNLIPKSNWPDKIYKGKMESEHPRCKSEPLCYMLYFYIPSSECSEENMDGYIELMGKWLRFNPEAEES